MVFALFDTSAFGATEQYVFSHLHYLLQHGYKIILATTNARVEQEIKSRLSKKEKKHFHIVTAPYRFDAINNWKGLLKFFFILPTAYIWCDTMLRHLTNDYDEVICLWPGFSDRLAFSRLAKKYNIPLVWVEIGPLEPTFKKLLGFPKLLYRQAEKFPSHLVTTSLFTKKSILRNTNFKDSDVTLVYPGVKLLSDRQIKSYQKKASIWKGKEGYSQTKLFGVVIRSASENEVDMVIRSFALYLKKTKKDVKLLIVGDGSKRLELESLTKQLGIEKQVRFFGSVTEEEKRVIFSSLDTFIFSSASESDGFGMMTIEAMNLGIPVLTTAFGPQLEIVTDGKEGYKYKPHDAKDLARHIDMMLNLSTAKLRAMSREARKRVADFSEKKYQEIMHEVIEDALSR